MQLIINKIVVTNFKGFKGTREFSLTPITKITADNYQGKTSIAEAIVFALLGTNLQGTNKGLDTLIHKGQKSVSVEMEFTGVDGEEHHLVRKLTKSKRDIVLDGKKAKQIDVERVVGPADKFLPAFWPAALGAMKNSEAREFFMGMVKVPRPDEVLKKIVQSFQPYLNPHKAQLYDPADLAKELRQENKQTEKEIERCNGQIEAYKEILEKPLPEILDCTELNSQLAEIDSQLDALADADTKLLEEKLVELRVQAKEIKRQCQELKFEVNPGDACPTCGQVVTQKYAAKVMQDIEQKKNELYAKYQQVVAEGQALKEQLDNKKKAAEEKRQELRAKRTKLQEQLNKYNQHNAAVKHLEEQKSEAQQKINELQQEIDDNYKAVEHNNLTLDAIKEYSLVQVELVKDQIQRHLNRCSIQLFEVAKTTGEIKPVCKILYDNKPYEILSASERIRLGLEIADFIKKATGIEFPTFIDNAESITHYDAPAGQIIEAKVVPGTELTIS